MKQPIHSQPVQHQQRCRNPSSRGTSGSRQAAPTARMLLLVVVVFAAAGAVTQAAGRGWDDDDSTPSQWHSSSSSGSSQAWGGGSSTSTRQLADGGGQAGMAMPGPPPAPTRSSGDTDVGKNSHNKGEEAQPGFSGGFLPRTRRCSNANLPGCQSCSGDVCHACYAVLGDASFLLDEAIHQCVCPPGYGKVEDAGTIAGWWRRRLSGLDDVGAEAGGSSSFNSSSSSSGISGSVFWPFNLSLSSPAVLESTLPAIDNVSVALALQSLPPLQQMPPPPWATDCLPCPVNYFSPGGSVGFAQCKPCPGDWTTGGATASADCLVPYCGAGQGASRRAGRCWPCPFGTFRPASAANTSCLACPTGFTTPTRGSASFTDCRVPICKAGQQLDMDLFVCTNCTGNTVSPGGTRANGPYQPFCQECPTFTAAVNRTTCLDDACPPPDAFSIVCTNATKVPACGPGAKPFLLDGLCTALPAGAQLQWLRAAPSLSSNTYDYTSLSSLLGVAAVPYEQPPVVTCPAGANGTNVWWPVITAFKGRTNCFCLPSTSCRFAATTGATVTPPLVGLVQSALVTANPNINVTVYDPQLASLRWLLGSIAPTNYTNYLQRLGSYCRPYSTAITSFLTSNTANNLTTSCLGPGYLSTINNQPWPYAVNGTLPAAVRLPGLSHLQRLNCTNCGLQGTLPPDWGTSRNLLALKYLTLPGSNFTGTLPSSWGGLTNLVNLTLSSAVTMPQIPSFWGNMRSLQFVNLTGLLLDESACAPRAWREFNGLVLGQTLLMPGSQDFCIS